MLTNILSLSLIQAGRLEPATEPVLVEPLARRIADDTSPQSSGHRFEFNFEASLPPVEADPGLLEQMLANLYQNAMKYSISGEVIRVSARNSANTVHIEVADDGVGIAPEHVDQVFERFRRPGAPPTVRGMGLGALSVSQPGRGTRRVNFRPLGLVPAGERCSPLNCPSLRDGSPSKKTGSTDHYQATFDAY